MSICEITKATRRESYLAIKPKRKSRQDLILDRLALIGPSTASFLAEIMYIHKDISAMDKNYVRPRLTELAHDGKVEVVGKQMDSRTGRMCAVYAIKY
jgi:hypothetical protein